MKNKSLITIAVAILIYLVSFQALNASGIDSLTKANGISVGYWGTMINDYGIQVGLDRYLLHTEKFDIIGNKSIVLQRKPNVYTSAGLILGSSMRRTYKMGLYFEYSINVGYLGRFYDFDIYKTNTDGQIVNVGRKWLSTGIFGYSAGVGYDFSKKTRLNLQFYAKPVLYYQYPNNENIFFINNYSFETGIIFHPAWLKSKKG